MIIALLSVRFIAFRNSLLRASPSERGKARANLVVSALVVLGVGAMSYSFFDPFVRYAEIDAAMGIVVRQIPSAALFTAFWMLLLSAVTVGIQRFYLNQEMNLLLAAPVSARAVFFAKFFEATLANASLFLAIGAPVMLAYSFARGNITPPYLLHLLLTLTAFSALPTGLGILLAFLMMRALPANRTRELLGALGILAFACVYFFLSISVTRTHDAVAMRQGTAALARRITSPIFNQGPWAWAGSVLSGDFDSTERWIAILLLWAGAAIVVLVTAFAAETLYLRGWATAQEVVVNERRASPVGEGWESRLSLMPGPMRAVFLKDFRSLRRDMRQLSLLFIPIAVVAVFLVQFSQTQVRNVPAALLVLGLYPILAMISLRLAMSGFVTENRAIWLMMAAPNDPRTVLAGKFAYAYALSMPLAGTATALYCLIRGMAGSESAAALGLAVCSVAAFCGIGVGASAIFSDFSSDNPRFTVSVGGRLTTFACQMGYLAVVVLVTGIAYATARVEVLPAAVAYSVAASVVVVVSAAFVVLPILLGAVRLRRLEW